MSACDKSPTREHRFERYPASRGSLAVVWRCHWCAEERDSSPVPSVRDDQLAQVIAPGCMRPTLDDQRREALEIVATAAREFLDDLPVRQKSGLAYIKLANALHRLKQ